MVVNNVALALDWVLYPRFRRQKIENPVFVVSLPRTGTTNLLQDFCLRACSSHHETLEGLMPQKFRGQKTPSLVVEAFALILEKRRSAHG